MIKRLSYADIRTSAQNQIKQNMAVKPLRPSKFLNDFESVPKNFIKEKEFEQVIEYVTPRPIRRRVALGNDKVNLKVEFTLPSVQNISIHSQEGGIDLKKSEILHIDKKIENELESINRKIKKIINSNKRQVTFQSSLIVIDEQNKISQIKDPYFQMDDQRRRKTIVRHKTLEV
ncbi:unnamed protein product [Paramecium sonneborni]|uniref:Uncharacterized protein n=1 Tax=Paramecium sonneborni TaxID=65129 RepID=A0A8S1LVX0_9CILI|nr:unnamed protein product [Paramecium sonneborni]